MGETACGNKRSMQGAVKSDGFVLGRTQLPLPTVPVMGRRG